MLFCGIYVAKHKHVALVVDEKGAVVKPAFAFANDRPGFDALLGALAGLDQPVSVAVEATGHYWLALYEELTRQEYPVSVLNPLQIAAYRRSGIRKLKSDTVDAFWIADYVHIASPAATPQDVPVLLQLRELSRFRIGLTQQIGDIKRQILAVLDRVFPEYETLFSTVFLKSSRELLKQAATADEIASFDLTELSQILHTASRGRLDTAQAVELQAAAQRSVGVHCLADAIRAKVRCLLEQIDLLEQQRAQLDDELATLMAQIPQFITSIPGVGPVIGAAILAEIADVHRFERLEQLVAYAGIDPAVYQTRAVPGYTGAYE
jgi:transposase